MIQQPAIQPAGCFFGIRKFRTAGKVLTPITLFSFRNIIEQMQEDVNNHLVYLFRYLYWLLAIDLLPLQIKIGWDNGLYIKFQKHSTFMKIKSDYYRSLSDKISRLELLEKILSDQEGIKAVVFFLPEQKHKFVQFYRRRKSLYLDYPAAIKYGSGFNRQAEVEKLLIKKGFVFNPTDKKLSAKQYYFEAIDGGKTLKAYFADNYKEAAEVTDKIFSGIYRSENKIEITLI